MIQAVTVDSLCQVAGRTINRDLKLPDSTYQPVHMVTLGKFFYVDIPDAPGSRGEWPRWWLLDSTLRTVVIRPPN